MEAKGEGGKGGGGGWVGGGYRAQRGMKEILGWMGLSDGVLVLYLKMKISRGSGRYRTDRIAGNTASYQVYTRVHDAMYDNASHDNTSNHRTAHKHTNEYRSANRNRLKKISITRTVPKHGLPTPPQSVPPSLPPSAPSSHDTELPYTESRSIHAPTLMNGLLKIREEPEHLLLLGDVVWNATPLPFTGDARTGGAGAGPLPVPTQDRLGLGGSDHPRRAWACAFQHLVGGGSRVVFTACYFYTLL